MRSKKEKATDSKSIEQADRFIQRLHDLEIVFKPRPKKEKDLKEISRKISFSILDYQRANKYLRLFYARILLNWVNKAYTMAFIEIGDGLTKKTNKLELENERLQDRLNECIKKCQKLRAEMNKFGKNYIRNNDENGDTIVGEPLR